MRKAIEARDTITEIADFFHTLAHKKDLNIAKGMSVDELARQARTKAPESLRGAVVRSTTAKMSKPRAGRPVLTATYEQKKTPGVVFFKKCVDVGTTSGPVTGTVKVCISCSIRKRQCVISIEIKGSITIG